MDRDSCFQQKVSFPSLVSALDLYPLARHRLEA
jgi:hypothetical protein